MSKYQYANPSPGVYKPWVSVSLRYGKTHKVTPAAIVALIDSGADVCFCSKDIGIWLGQLGFFDHFEVNFDFKKKTIEII